MTLSVTADSTSAPTKLTVVSDKRVRPGTEAVVEKFTITVETGGQTTTYSGTREVSPAVPGSTDPIKITDSRGRKWKVLSDDGTTAVLVIA